MTATMDAFLSEVNGSVIFPSEDHRTALELAVSQWGRDLDEEKFKGRKSLHERVKQAYKARLRGEGYGFVMITFLLITVLAAAISWAVERLLTWLYPPKTGGMGDAARIERLLCVRRAA
jgi:hypothetical protein